VRKGREQEEAEADAGAFLEAVKHPERREDSKAVRAMMERLSGHPPSI
jgi:hypothetical protein